MSSIKEENNRKSRLAPEGFKGKNARTRLLYNPTCLQSTCRTKSNNNDNNNNTVVTINDPSIKYRKYLSRRFT